MNPELKKLLFQAINIAVVGAVVSAFNWLSTNGYLKRDVVDAVQAGVVQIATKQDAAVEQITAQTDAQTEVLKTETKAEAKKTRQKVVEETNEVSATAEKVATELVEAVPMRGAQATDPAIAELLLELTARLEKI